MNQRVGWLRLVGAQPATRCEQRDEVGERRVHFRQVVQQSNHEHGIEEISAGKTPQVASDKARRWPPVVVPGVANQLRRIIDATVATVVPILALTRYDLPTWHLPAILGLSVVLVTAVAIQGYKMFLTSRSTIS